MNEGSWSLYPVAQPRGAWLKLLGALAYYPSKVDSIDTIVNRVEPHTYTVS
jgi:hypothetical protein